MTVHVSTRYPTARKTRLDKLADGLNRVSRASGKLLS